MYPSPILKSGMCPPGYTESGNMCVPTANAKPVIAKDGMCPPGWTASGNYCIKT